MRGEMDGACGGALGRRRWPRKRQARSNRCSWPRIMPSTSQLIIPAATMAAGLGRPRRAWRAGRESRASNDPDVPISPRPRRCTALAGYVQCGLWATRRKRMGARARARPGRKALQHPAIVNRVHCLCINSSNSLFVAGNGSGSPLSRPRRRISAERRVSICELWLGQGSRPVRQPPKAVDRVGPCRRISNAMDQFKAATGSGDRAKASSAAPRRDC